MRDILNRIKLVIAAILLAAAPLGIIGNSFAADEAENIKNGETVEAAGGVKLYKTAALVEDDVTNAWDVTLRVESPKTYEQTDTVIVIDRSSSMEGKLDAVKSLAKTLSTQLLNSAPLNKVAVVSFAEQGDQQFWNLTTSNTTVAVAVESLTPASTNGAFTQAALDKAVELLSSSNAKYKNIVLISGSTPNRSYEVTITSIRNCSEQYGSYGTTALMETVPHIKECTFSSNVKGTTDDIRTYAGYNIPEGRANYNHGNAAIFAVKEFKSGENQNVISVSVDNMTTDGSQALKNISSDDTVLPFTSSDDTTATPIINKIVDAKEKSAIPVADGAKVTDTIATGFTATATGAGYTITDNVLDWEPEFTFSDEKGLYEAEITYRVEINSDILDVDDEGGFYPLNEEAVIEYEYNGEPVSGEFSIPQVDPTLVSITKLLEQDPDCTECLFYIGLNGEDFSISVPVSPDETLTLAEVFSTGTYAIEETETENNDIKLENYLIEYSDAEIVIEKGIGTDFEITVTNIYETVDIDVTTLWDDAFDQDKLRPAEYAVTLLGNGKPVETRNITEADGWKTTFKAMPKNYNGEPINYTLESTEIAEYETTVDGDMESGFKITHKHTPKLAPAKPDTGFSTATATSKTSAASNNITALVAVVLGTMIVLSMAVAAKIKKH